MVAFLFLFHLSEEFLIPCSLVVIRTGFNLSILSQHSLK